MPPPSKIIACMYTFSNIHSQSQSRPTYFSSSSCSIVPFVRSSRGGEGGERHSGRPAIRFSLTAISSDTISPHLVKEFYWNLAQIFVMCVELLRRFSRSKVRGQDRSEKKYTF